MCSCLEEEQRGAEGWNQRVVMPNLGAFSPVKFKITVSLIKQTQSLKWKYLRCHSRGYELAMGEHSKTTAFLLSPTVDRHRQGQGLFFLLQRLSLLQYLVPFWAYGDWFKDFLNWFKIASMRLNLILNKPGQLINDEHTAPYPTLTCQRFGICLDVLKRCRRQMLLFWSKYGH